MPRRTPEIRHAEIVGRFAARLRELRRSRGLTQVELARRAELTPTYVGRLESGGAAPGIDLVERLAAALGTSVADLLPAEAPPNTAAVLREQARQLFDSMVKVADREALLMICPLLARLNELMNRSR